MSDPQPEEATTQPQDQEPRSPHCAYLRDDGTRCRAMARRPSDFCYWHDPETASDRGTGAREAAVAPADPLLALLPPDQPLQLQTASDVSRLLELTARYLVGAARPDFKRAQAVNTVAATLLRTIDVVALEQDLLETRSNLAASNRRLDQELCTVDRLTDRVAALIKERDHQSDRLRKYEDHLRRLNIGPTNLPDPDEK